MTSSSPLIVLTFFTLLSGVIIVGASFAYSLRKRENQEIASRALLGRDDSEVESDRTADGVLPDLLAVMVVALLAMALLASAYFLR
ncbi:hypothetical protein F6X38_09015 [Aureimonas leprariae]|uniref:Uncharacterized protein n=1 Tax=Plantimonas leprariae TaxID=2615207 RepID=A0A7V7TWS0_9HYPH|nr:hypothetical protein F6X38_09015 [Aureimonas leprariae]